MSLPKILSRKPKGHVSPTPPYYAYAPAHITPLTHPPHKELLLLPAPWSGRVSGRQCPLLLPISSGSATLSPSPALMDRRRRR